MRFFVDELSLAGEFSKEVLEIDRLSDLLDAMERLQKIDQCSLFIAPNFYNLEFSGLSIAQLIFQERSTEFRDLVLRLQRAIDATVELGETVIDNGINRLQSEGRGGLVSLIDRAASDWWNADGMRMLIRVSEMPKVLRFLFVVFDLDEEDLEATQSAMFPGLYFYVFPTCKKLNVNGKVWVQTIIQHLSWLNDEAAIAFASRFQDVINIAGSSGVEISSESPKTHRDAAAMKEREILIATKPVLCEWHSKFEATNGRLHFNAFSSRSKEVEAVVGKKVIIGIAAAHLK